MALFPLSSSLFFPREKRKGKSHQQPSTKKKKEKENIN